MKTPYLFFARRLFRLAAPVIFAALTAVNSCADFALSVSIDQFGSPEQSNVSYGIFIGLNTTNVPITYFEVYSSHSNSYTGVGTGSSFNVLPLADFNAVKNELTNGPWKLILNAGDPSQKIYYFNLSLSGFTSNVIFPDVNILNPTNNSSDVPTNTLFEFTGPSAFQSLDVFLDEGNNYFASAGLSTSATSWSPNKAMDMGSNYDFIVQYTTDGSPYVNYSTPTNSTNGQALAGWSTTTSVILQDDDHFTTESSSITLQSALDAPNLTWSTSGDALWFGESDVSYDGVSAAQSGVMQDDQMSVLQTTINGGGSISFYWATMGEADEFDLEFDVDGQDVNDLPSQMDWQQYTYTFSDTNTHVLTWTAYSGGGSSTDDAGYVDQVVYTPASATPPPVGSWSRTGSMTTDRGQFTLTLLGNGKALAAGGLIEGFPEASTSSADLYNPAAGTWTNTGYMNTDRRAHTATVLPGGKVLVAGGVSGLLNGPKVSSSEIYDPTSGVWVNTTGSMHVARAGHTATLLNSGLVLVAGGSGDTSSELYNPSTQTWTTTTGPMNEVRSVASAFLLPSGKVLVVGGASNNTVEIYDPAVGQWSFGNSMLKEQDNPIGVMLTNGMILIAGGANSNGTTSFSEIYDPNAGTWTETGFMKAARSSASGAVMANGLVLASGGDGNSGTLTSAELYDPTQGTWTLTGSMLDARDQYPSLLLPDGAVLVAGGFYATAELYSSVVTSIVLTNATLVPGSGFRFGFAHTSGSTNIVFATANVNTPFTNWTSLGAATEISSGQFQFTDPSTNLPRRFYRVRSP